MKDVIASPSVRALALQKGIDLKELASALNRETITREDLQGTSRNITQISTGTSHWDVDHAAFGPVRREPMTRFAKVAAANLEASNAMIPQVTHHDRADVSMIEALRADWKEEAQVRGVKLTALAFHVKALAHALRAYPRFNASLAADTETLILKDYVHIGVAVDTEHGLMVPVVRDADQKGLWLIASEIAALAARAQRRKIGPNEMGGASMTITNLGGLGGTAFTPIVNPPEVAILGITRVETVTVWDGEKPTPRPMVPLDLSYDHRVINGADAARFMNHLCGLLSDPRQMTI
ncbi:2-oxo acid dehydrogenase subunit E2 [Ruegeria atlantica]|uniref:2-oxo acid dehydrogenase subunit E2 n=1 Tax=Ruegeria atlantica TaxID=81569 RepID=UPI00147CC580|nr:2-oxo acid dehydrogenase subunit E2 [Ruegeria atlantica]